MSGNNIPSDSPPSYDETEGSTNPAPRPAITFSGPVTEREEASRYGEGARFLRLQEEEREREQQQQRRRRSGESFDSEDGEDLPMMSGPPMESFDDIEEPDQQDSTTDNSQRRRITSVFITRATVVSTRIARSLNSKIISPVQRIIIDPVARVWNNINARFDDILSKFGNPLMFRRLIYLLLVAFSVFVVVSTGVLSSVDPNYYHGNFHDHNKMRIFIKDTIDPQLIKDRLKYMSSMSHMAGTAGDVTLANYVRDEFESFGMVSDMEFSEEHVYLTYPDTKKNAIGLRMDGYEADLSEGVAYKSPQEYQKQPKTYHAFSPSGTAKGPIMYVNYGTEEDYRDLDVQDAIVFMKYGKMETGLKVILAEKKGAKGVVMFNEEPKGKGWPDGPGYPEDAVERGNVAAAAIAPGDIVTPGWSLKQHNQGLDINLVKSVPKIPSVPISRKQVKPFLDKLADSGKRFKDNQWSGDKSKSPDVELKNSVSVKEKHPIWNVFAQIPGIDQSDKVVIIGASRDSFCYGAVEPMSGTAVLLELARVLTQLRHATGWRPLRTIQFASWDASEHNYAGSTEWVEYNRPALVDHGVAYINLDSVSGDKLTMDGNPLFDNVVHDVLRFVHDPVDNRTLSEDWVNKKLPVITNQGDQIAFNTHAGVPSLNVGFQGQEYPKHSCFDTFEWIEKFGDSNFQYHATLVNVAANILLQYADQPLIKFNFAALGHKIHDYARDVEEYAREKKVTGLDFKRLISQADKMVQLGVRIESWAQEWHQIAADGEPPILLLRRREWNSLIAILNKKLMDPEGLPDRNFFKHTIFGPQVWHPVDSHYEWQTMPAVRDAIEKGDSKLAQESINRINTCIDYVINSIVQ